MDEVLSAVVPSAIRPQVNNAPAGLPATINSAARVIPTLDTATNNSTSTQAITGGSPAISVTRVAGNSVSTNSQAETTNPAIPSNGSASNNSEQTKSSSSSLSSEAISPRSTSNDNALPVIAAQWVAGGGAGLGRVDIQLPRQAIGSNGPGVLIQLPPQAAAITSAVGSSDVRLSNLDNAPAPSWVQYSPQTGGLVISNVPAGSLPAQIKISVGNAQVTIQINAPGN